MSDYYRFDLSKITFSECWRHSPRWGPLFNLALIKLFGGSTGDSMAFRGPQGLSDIAVAREGLPALASERLAPVEAHAVEQGFREPVYYRQDNRFIPGDICGVTMYHTSGKAFIDVVHRHMHHVHPPLDQVDVILTSTTTDGRACVTSTEPQMVDAPAHIDREIHVGASFEALWHRHQERIQALTQPIAPASSANAMVDLMEQIDCSIHAYNLQRGITVKLADGELARAEATVNQVAEAMRAESPVGIAGPASGISAQASGAILQPAGEALVAGESDVRGSGVAAEEAPACDEGDLSVNAFVLREVRRLEDKANGRRSFVRLFVISAVLFVLAGSAWWTWDFVAALIVVLLIHEAGHYVAMRALNYRNLRILLIPLFGAAVVGHNYNVAGWKKAIVSLAGPVPGIALGIGLGITAAIYELSALRGLASLMLFINVLNLLPFLPLDGGVLLHATVFCRHPWVEVAFRAVCIAVLLAAAALLGIWVLGAIAVLMTMGVPSLLRLWRVTRRVRARGLLPGADDNRHIPPATVLAIVEETRRESGGRVRKPALPTFVLGVFERINARPPGAGVTVLLLAAHAWVFVVGLVAWALLQPL